ncbi:hypothetical protein C4561_01580 [candidate division WWE3 bacterium]|jgi:hypothetical protein|uniref:Phage tail protein n=1 Tax=candidate division WWE3 bacterium TaxID=2053526 RepID=A0A3A4ZF18_UNCKA|nr:MAG: hypothetical protein C4561_01580 [candidate division WWE3 bacterium]
MTMRALYQDIYLFMHQVVGISTSGSFGVTDIGLNTNVFNLVPTAHPNLIAGQQISDVRKATGLSQKRTGSGYEFVQTLQQPSVTGVSVEMTTKNLGAWLWLFFQQGVSQGGAAVYKKTAVPYTDSDCEVWASIARVLDTGSQSHQVDGAVINQLAFSGVEGGVVSLTADFIGSAFSRIKDVDTITTAIPSEVPFLHQNCTVTLGGNTIRLQSFDLTLNNNAERRYYNSTTPQKIVLGDLSVSGTIVIPWTQTNYDRNNALADFIAGTDQLLTLTWGTASVNEVVIKVNMRFSGDPDILTDKQDLSLSLPFIGAYDGTNHAIEITCEDSVNRGIA